MDDRRWFLSFFVRPDPRSSFLIPLNHYPILVLVLPLMCLGLLVGDTGVVFGKEPVGVIRGTIYLPNKTPSPKLHTIREDREYCGNKIAIQAVSVVGADKALQDALVYLDGSYSQTVISGFKRRHQITNVRCAFSPRILVAMKGDTLEIFNHDPILHNTHISLGRRTFLNVAQLPNNRPIVKRIRKKGMYAVQCDKHTFMKAHLWVFPHPFFSLSDETGTFEIQAVPVGHHRIRVWHETLGSYEQSIQVLPETPTRVEISWP